MAGLSGKEAIVVGAGPAGLAAALALQAMGAKVRVLERAEAPGGRAGFDSVGEWRFDRGAEFVASFYPNALRLIRRLGLEAGLSRVPLAGDYLKSPSIEGAITSGEEAAARVAAYLSR